MDYIQVSQSFTAVIDIPESQSSDSVTYKVYKASTGFIFAQGNAVFVAGINWKISFTPDTLDVYVVEVSDTTIDVVYSQNFQSINSAVLTQPVEGDTPAPTASELIILVDRAIKTRLLGGAVQSYSIGGRNLQYMTLSELRSLRADLSKQIAAQNGGGRNYAKFVNPD